LMGVLMTPVAVGWDGGVEFEQDLNPSSTGQ
jgi:hypothetical protein